MKDCTTRYFCREFGACLPGTRFALKHKTMRECYDALLAGEAGDKSRDWAIWTATRPGVMSDRDLRLFAVHCARRVQPLMKDQRSVTALEVAERYARGEATDEELAAARLAARDAAWAAGAADAAWAVGSAAWAAGAADAAWAAARAAEDAAWAAENEAQLGLLAEFGNPFRSDACRA